MYFRVLTPDRGIGVLEASLSPWAAPFVLFLLVVSWVIASRMRWLGILLGAIATVSVIVQIVWIAPFYLGAHAHGRIDLTVMESNLYYGRADVDQVLATARTEHAGLLVLTEITPQALERFDRAGIEDLLPYSLGQSASDQNGTMVFSRYPLTKVHSIALSRGGYTARVAAPRPFTLVAAHADAPAYAGLGWDHDMDALKKAVATIRGPRLLIGDLNGSVDVRQIRAVMHAGDLADAAVQANSGWQPTWPGTVGHGPLRRIGLAMIDHVMVGPEFSAVSTSTALIDGTDHRTLIARLADR
jgi:endonuclease/exonuclease/phosphatase (EEP) superfamily protein YafD